MRNLFRQGFYLGLTAALLIGLFLIWLWRPEHQLDLHSRHLLQAIEKKDWDRFVNFLASNYHDDWGNDRGLAVDRSQEVFRYVRRVRLVPNNPVFESSGGEGFWQAVITVEGDEGEVASILKERVNSLKSPFKLQWRHMSAKPWDWQLTGVSNPDLKIPEGY